MNLTAKKEKSRKKYFYIRKTAAKGTAQWLYVLTAVVILTAPAVDDVPVVSPKGSGFTEHFTKLYKEICHSLNVPLAPECGKHEKVFGPTTFGTVLGINFDSVQMTWALSGEKEASIQNAIDDFIIKKTCTLLEIQKLHGKLSDLALSCEFMLGFRHHLIQLLGKFGIESSASND